MELLTLCEIPDLNKTFSDDQFLYIPLQDERILLSSVLTTSRVSKIDIDYSGVQVFNDIFFGCIRPPVLERVFTLARPIKSELNIDNGIIDTEIIYKNKADYVFEFGLQYALRFLWYKTRYDLPLSIETISSEEVIPVDLDGFKLSKYCNEHSHIFLHPVSMIDDSQATQFFIPAFKKRYGAPFTFIGNVYEDDYQSWPFIESTHTTLGQVFLLGVSWVLNHQRIKEMMIDTWNNAPQSLFQYPVWHAYRPDFPKKWPWSKEYDGSEPEIALKYVRHI